MLAGLRGAVGFLSRLPVGHDEAAWEAFTAQPVAFTLVGYALGGVLAVPLLLPGPAPTAAFLFIVAVYALTGINHADGVTDLGDAVVVHGSPERRREVMKDTTVGVGGVLALSVVVLGLGTAGLGVAALPHRAVLLVVTAEVVAKTGMALLVCLGSATHEGLATPFTERASPMTAVPVVLLAVPAAVVPGLATVVPSPRPSLALSPVFAGAAAFSAGLVAAMAVFVWARRHLDGVNGDVFGATNELARVAALHAGVIAWTLW